MKKWIVIVILLVIVVLGASFMFKSHNETQQKENTTEAYEISENGVALTVPSTWVSAKSKSNMTLLAVADPNSKDSSGFSNVNINVEKKETTNTLKNEFESNYKSLSRNSDYEIEYLGNATVQGNDAMEAAYLTTGGSVVKEHKAVWLQGDGVIYVILCTSPQDQFDNYEPIFDYAINSVKIS